VGPDFLSGWFLSKKIFHDEVVEFQGSYSFLLSIEAHFSTSFAKGRPQLLPPLYRMFLWMTDRLANSAENDYQDFYWDDCSMSL